VLFELNNQTVNSTINDINVAMQGQRNRNLGGHIMQLGGVLRLEGCTCPPLYRLLEDRGLSPPPVQALGQRRPIMSVE
jgi:hypothetical protein